MNAPSNLNTELGLSLALAVVASSNAPLLLLDGSLRIVAASDSFCHAFQIVSPPIMGASLADLGAGEWGGARLGSLLAATSAGHADIDAYEMDLERAGQKPRRLVLNAKKLAYGDRGDTRILLAVSDVTEARLSERMKADLVHQKEILLQELQHRVANSLQIIASVIMLSARQALSEETRNHLSEAHHRVMSVAAMQKQLAISRQGDVALRAYFTDLCRSIGASMIRDHKQLTLDVTTDESAATADVSMSLGLIVTELVINALKHAFPDHRHGHIKVDYRSEGEFWKLSVGDDGVGMVANEGKPKSGLGTSIVSALAQQLNATITVAAANPGTEVSVVHGAPVASGQAARPEPAQKAV